MLQNLEVWDALPDATVVIDDSGTILYANAAWKAFAIENGGNSESFYVGDSYYETCQSAAETADPMARQVHDGLKDALRTKTVFRCEYPCHSPVEERWFELIGSPFTAGQSDLLAVMHRNITVQKRNQNAVARARRSANELAALVASSPDAIISFDLEGRIRSWNEGAREVYGYSPEEVIGRSMEVLYPPGWPVRITEYRDQILSGKLTRFEVDRVRKDGAVRKISISAAPIRDDRGGVLAISNIHRDVTAEKEAEERLRFIAAELNHRTKNILAVVMAMARQTARVAQDLPEFHESFENRVSSLAHANDLLVSNGWISVDLLELIRKEFAGYLEPSRGKGDLLSIDMTPVSLRAEAVQPIAMSLHELKSNSLKYGVLGKGEGSVQISWKPAEEAGLRLTWKEMEVRPRPGPPTRKGFGHSVLTGLAGHTFGTMPVYEIGVDQVLWQVTLPESFIDPASHRSSG